MYVHLLRFKFSMVRCGVQGLGFRVNIRYNSHFSVEPDYYGNLKQGNLV